MRPYLEENHRPPPFGPAARRPGVAPHTPGAALARARIARHQGFTPAVPSAAAARRVIEEGARQLGLHPGAARTLGAMLTLYRGWGLRRPPRLAATNAEIALRAGCDERTVQKHLALLRAHGLVAVEYGPHNRRRPGEDAGPADPAGIDLRPAVVVAAELQARLAALAQARREAIASLYRAQRALLQARAALAAGGGTPDPAAVQALNARRAALRRLRRKLGHPAATVDGLAQIRAEIEAERELALRLDRGAFGAATFAPAAGGDDTGDKTTDSSSRDGAAGIHQTEANSVDTSDRFKVGRSDAEDGHDRQAPTLDELTDQEIEARRQAHRLGLAARHLNQAIERHGTAAVVQVVAHVHRQHQAGRVRNPGGLLASLLRRPRDGLTPTGPHGFYPVRPPLLASEARAIAAELAPAHNPHWLWQRFETYRRRCGAELRDERRAFAGFARKCQQDYACGRRAPLD